MKKIYILGSINMDIVISSPYMPINGETITGNDFMTNPGGKGANQAVACGKMENEVYFAGCVGDDAFGKELINTLEGYCVNTSYIRKVENTSSGTAVIIIVDHDNRIILAPNANKFVNNTDVDNLLSNANEGDIFLTQLEIPLDVVGYGLKKAKEKKMITILNPAPANININSYLSYVDIFIPNETELNLYTNNQDDILTKCQELEKKYHIPIIIVTLGKEGHATYNHGILNKTPCIKVKPVDTTAAGDTFCGVLASMLAREKEMEEALCYASICASLSITKKGAQQSIPTYNDLKKFFVK